MSKTTTLRAAFWKFLLHLLVGLALAVAIPFTLSFMSSSLGIASYADYSERSVKNIAPVIASAPSLDEIELPAGSHYLLLDKNYHVIKSSLAGDELDQAIHFASTGTNDTSSKKQFLLVTRENEVVILQYSIGSQFTNTWMNKYLPAPDTLLFILIALNCLAVCTYLTSKFSKKLRLQLLPLSTATQEVTRKNLDYEVGHSSIQEFEDVLISFATMKESLKNSLEQQWKIEHEKKRQIAALAHDLKTPLTVIQGNSELMNESDLNAQQQLYTEYILNSSHQMQVYIKALIDISNSDTVRPIRLKTFEVGSFFKQLLPQIQALCETKRIKLEVKISETARTLTADTASLESAVMNVINNAVEYSPIAGTIRLDVQSADTGVDISIVDEGKGFSPSAIRHGKEQFYRDDLSRKQDHHFGMGLFIANTIVEQHGGKMRLENTPESGGAKVIIHIP